MSLTIPAPARSENLRAILAMLGAMASLIVKPALVIATASAAAVTAASLGLAPFETWRMPSAGILLLVIGAGFGLVGGYYWIVVAMRSGDIAVVAPFRYATILYAVLAGFVVWGEIPDAATWVGIAIVTAAGLYTLLRERRLAKAACA